MKITFDKNILLLFCVYVCVYVSCYAPRLYPTVCEVFGLNCSNSHTYIFMYVLVCVSMHV